MKVYNSLTRTLEPFEPLDGRTVRMYTCGPTVYNFAHIGNFRAYVFEDLLRRALKYHGWGVVQVMNLTDVDDKTIRGARAQGVPLRDYTAPYTRAFFEDLKTLRIEPAEHYPAATEHIPEMIALIERLLAAGCAYRTAEGSVYFNVGKFAAYGKLAHLDPSGMRAGARVASDEYGKDSAADFALWKAWDEQDGEVAWDAPWGRGRPGWHIECSAMSMKYLGESFDMHTGGIDNLFPHHENEIAQSEAATGKPFVRYWLHCGYLVVDGAKMSKSLGNFYTLRDLLARGYSGREVRYALLSAHYRQPLNFTFAALEAARAALGRLDDFRERLAERAGAAAPAGRAPAWLEEGRRRFQAAVEDDLNLPEALSAVFETVTAGNRALDGGGLSAAEAAAAADGFEDLDRVLGCLRKPEELPDERAAELLARREAARREKNWAAADALRAELAGLGWEVRDTPRGPKLKRRTR